MDAQGGRRTGAERDAATVEIGYALASAGFAAAVLFGAVAEPALALDLTGLPATILLRLGAVVAAVVFAARVVSVLVRFQRSVESGRPDRRTTGKS